MEIIFVFMVILLILIMVALSLLVGYNFRVYETKEFKKKKVDYSQTAKLYDTLKKEEDRVKLLDQVYYGSDFERDLRKRSRELYVQEETEKMKAGASLQEAKSKISSDIGASGSIDSMAKKSLGFDLDKEFNKMASYSDIDAAEGV